MKKIILLLSVLLSLTTSYAQQFHMSGRFSNTTPDVDALIDSAAFNFTNSGYTYFVDDNPNPSSFGTYEIIIGGMSDTLVLYEDSLGVCSDNGTGATVKLEIDKTVTPFYSIILSETSHSMQNCTSHSLQMSGDFIATSGVIFNWAASVKDAKSDIGLRAYTFEGKLMVNSNYNEKVSVTVTNISGQKVTKTQEATLSAGHTHTFDFDGLSRGIYFIFLQSEHGRKTVKVAI